MRKKKLNKKKWKKKNNKINQVVTFKNLSEKRFHHLKYHCSWFMAGLKPDQDRSSNSQPKSIQFLSEVIRVFSCLRLGFGVRTTEGVS